MPYILHLIEELDNSYRSMAILSAAAASMQTGEYHHSFVVLESATPEATQYAKSINIEILVAPREKELMQLIDSTDIVHVEYQNQPALNTLLHKEIPPHRLLFWYHISGDKAPQVIPDATLKMADLCIASHKRTLEVRSVFDPASADHVDGQYLMITPPADFNLVDSLLPTDREGFFVGYLASPNQVDVAAINETINIPEIQFISLSANQSPIDAEPGVEAFRDAMAALDVMGIPVNKAGDTPEIPLQLAMFAGIPPVVFADNPAASFIKHNETGLIVDSVEAYSRVIEFLYHNPVERERIGLNASIFARTHLGATNAAQDLNSAYDQVMTFEKREHAWDEVTSAPVSNQAGPVASVYLSDPFSPEVENKSISLSQIFADGLDVEGMYYNMSLDHPMASECIAVEKVIADMSSDTHQHLKKYLDKDPEDPYLQLWSGLYHLAQNEAAMALPRFAAAIEHGLDAWRIQWYLAQALYETGKTEESQRIYLALRKSIPDFEELTEDNRFAIKQTSSFEFSISGTSTSPESPSSEQSGTNLAPEAPENTVTLSAIVALQNGEEFIDGCLHDLVSQSLYQKGELEILLIDTENSDKSARTIQRYQSHFNQIQHIPVPEAETRFASWNRAIKMANGTYVAGMLPQDRHRKDALEVLTGYLDAHPEFALIYAGQIETPVANESFETTNAEHPTENTEYTYELLETQHIIGSQPVWRKSVHNVHGYFDDSLAIAGDYEFWLRMGKQEAMYKYPELMGLRYNPDHDTEFTSQQAEDEMISIWQHYGLMERGLTFTHNTRTIAQARVPEFTEPTLSVINAERKPFDQYITEYQEALNAGRIEEALNIAKETEENYSELPYPLVLMAIAHRQNGDFNDALAALELSIKRDETPEALIELIQLSVATGQLEEAERTSTYVQDKYPEWKDKLSTISQQWMQDQTPEAEGRASIEDLDYSISSFQDLKNQFLEFTQHDQIEQAETLALAATMKFPNNHEAWVLKATSDRLKGSFLDARESIHRSLLIEDSPEALIELFHVSLAIGDSKEAKNIADMFDIAYPEYSSTFGELFPDFEA